MEHICPRFVKCLNSCGNFNTDVAIRKVRVVIISKVAFPFSYNVCDGNLLDPLVERGSCIFLPGVDNYKKFV